MKKTSFNDHWTCKKQGDSAEPKPVTLPHDAMLFEKRDRNAATAGACGYFPGGVYEYTKRFALPETERGRTHILEFEAVYKNAKVYINGSLAAERPYGYSNFYVLLDEHLCFGEENEITVIADNSAVPNSRWYSGSGIYRNVSLYSGESSHILPDGLLISTLNNDIVNVKVSASGGDEICVKIYDGDSVAAESVAPVSEGTAEVSLKVTSPRLWDAEHPELYRCCVELLQDRKTVDETEDSFGFRTLAWNVKGFFVNGKETLLRGACIHHDNGILGACSFTSAEERRVRLLKEAGFNAIRSAHNPASKALLEACDRLGMYVMDEFCDNWLVHKNPYDYANQEFLAWWEQECSQHMGNLLPHSSAWQVPLACGRSWTLDLRIPEQTQ